MHTTPRILWGSMCLLALTMILFLLIYFFPVHDSSLLILFSALSHLSQTKDPILSAPPSSANIV